MVEHDLISVLQPNNIVVMRQLMALKCVKRMEIYDVHEINFVVSVTPVLRNDHVDILMEKMFMILIMLVMHLLEIHYDYVSDDIQHHEHGSTILQLDSYIMIDYISGHGHVYQKIRYKIDNYEIVSKHLVVQQKCGVVIGQYKIQGTVLFINNSMNC